jgi:ABC-type lipoprotein release transport system permease subunit
VVHEVLEVRKVRRVREVLRVLAVLILAAGPAHAAPAGDEPAILVSRQLLAKAHLSVGDVVTFAADANGTRARQFRIAGVYEPTPDPMKFNVERLETRLHLDDLLGIVADPSDPAAADAVSAINVSLADPTKSSSFSRALAARTPFVLAISTRDSENSTFQVVDRFHTAIAAVTVVGSTAFLLALMVIRAEERKETVGILRLIGISRQTIMTEVVVEGLLVAIAGAGIGVLIAAAAQHGVNRFFQARYDTALVFMRVSPAIAARSVLVSVPVGVVAGAVASWTLLRRRAAALVRR